MRATFNLPLAGENVAVARSAQPPGTALSLSNCRIRAVQGGRMQLGPRPGLINLLSGTNAGGGVNGTSGVSLGTGQFFLLHRAVFMDASSNAASFLIAVNAGNLYSCTVPNPVAGIAGATNLVGSGTFLSSRFVYAAQYGAYLYMTDGATPKKLKLDDNTLGDWTATDGTVPTDYRLLIQARGRMWMAKQTANPQNWACSRQGDPLDWDSGEEDVGAAVFSNTGFRGGAIGSPIQALIAGEDDSVIFGCEDAIYELIGEPTRGQLLVRSQGIGILTSTSWCTGPRGEIYFVGPGGFYVMPRGQKPTPLNWASQREFFQGLPYRTKRINLVYDPDDAGVHIFTQPNTLTGASHLYYDLQTDSFVRDSIADGHGPVRAILWDDGENGGRRVILGGTTGIIAAFAKTKSTTGGGTNVLGVASDVSPAGTSGAKVAITSSFKLLAGKQFEDQTKALDLRIDLGDVPAGFATADMNLTLTLQCGDDAKEAADSPKESAAFTFSNTSGGQAPQGIRMAGGDFVLKGENSTIDKVWSLDSAEMTITGGGRQR